jgi:NADPH:quinone reductase-like Zn-dependent oxidoreductase
MKAVVLERYGTPAALQLKDVATPVPGGGDVLVRVQAASVNDWDWEIVRGKLFTIRILHGLFTPRVQIIGCDIAGRVAAVGRDVTDFKPGDRVYGDLCMHGFSALAEYVCAPQTCLTRMPAGMSFEQAAAIPQAGMLAVQGLIDVSRIQHGQTVLLNGAGGGVGTFALQIAKKLYGARVTAVDKAGKLAMLRALGADEVIDYQKEDFTRSGDTYDVILDTKTNRSPRAYLRALKPNGTYATVGGSIPRLMLMAVVAPAISRISNKRLRMVGLKPNKDLAYVNQLFEAGTLTPVIDKVYSLADAPDAFRFFGTGDHKGKLVINIA